MVWFYFNFIGYHLFKALPLDNPGDERLNSCPNLTITHRSRGKKSTLRWIIWYNPHRQPKLVADETTYISTITTAKNIRLCLVKLGRKDWTHSMMWWLIILVMCYFLQDETKTGLKYQNMLSFHGWKWEILSNVSDISLEVRSYQFEKFIVKLKFFAILVTSFCSNLSLRFRRFGGIQHLRETKVTTNLRENLS